MSKTIAAFVSLERRIESLQAEIDALNLEIQAYKSNSPSNTREFLPRHEVLPDLFSHVETEMETLQGKDDPHSIFLGRILLALGYHVTKAVALIERYTYENGKK